MAIVFALAVAEIFHHIQFPIFWSDALARVFVTRMGRREFQDFQLLSLWTIILVRVPVLQNGRPRPTLIFLISAILVYSTRGHYLFIRISISNLS